MRRVPESLRDDAAEDFLLLEDKPGVVLKDVRGIVGTSRAVDIKVAHDKDGWETRCCRRSLRAVIFFELSKILVEHDLAVVKVPTLIAGTSFLLTSFEMASLGPPLPPEPPPPKDEQWVPNGYEQDGFGEMLLKAGMVVAGGALIGGAALLIPHMTQAFGMLGDLFMKGGAMMAGLMRDLATCMAEHGLGCIFVGIKRLMSLVLEGALWFLELYGRFGLFIIKFLWKAIKFLGIGLGSGIAKLAGYVWNNLDNALLSAVTFLLSAYWRYIKFMIMTPINAAISVVGFILGGLPDVMKVFLKGWKSVIGFLLSGLDLIGPLALAIGDVLNGLANGLASMLTGAIDAVGWLGNAFMEGAQWLVGALGSAFTAMPGFLEMLLAGGLKIGHFILGKWADFMLDGLQFMPLRLGDMLFKVISGGWHLAGDLLKILGEATWKLFIFMGEMALKLLEGMGDLLSGAPALLLSGVKLIGKALGHIAKFVGEFYLAVFKAAWWLMKNMAKYMALGVVDLMKAFGQSLWWIMKGLWSFASFNFNFNLDFFNFSLPSFSLPNFSLAFAKIGRVFGKINFDPMLAMLGDFFGAAGSMVASIWGTLKKISVSLGLDCHGAADCFLLIMDMIFFVMIMLIMGGALLEPKIYEKPGWEYDEMDPATMGQSDKGGREHPHFTDPVEEEETGDWIQEPVKKPKDGINHEKELEDRPPEMFRGPVKAAWETTPGSIQLMKEIDDEAMTSDGILESDFWRCHPGLDNVQYNQHPVIKFRDPIDKVKVTFTDEDTQEVHWENAYKLSTPGVLDQNAMVIDGSAPAFKRICPDPDDLNGHTFELKATRYPPLDPTVNEAEEENEIATVYYKAWRVKDPSGPQATSALQVSSWPPPYPRPGVPTGVPRIRPGGVRGRDYIMNLPPSSGAILWGAYMNSYTRHSRAHEHSQFLSSVDIVSATSAASVQTAQAPALAQAQATTFQALSPQPHQAMQIWEAAQAQQQMLWKYLHIPASPRVCWRTFALARMAYRWPEIKKKATDFFAPAPVRSEQDATTAASSPF